MTSQQYEVNANSETARSRRSVQNRFFHVNQRVFLGGDKPAAAVIRDDSTSQTVSISAVSRLSYKVWSIDQSRVKNAMWDWISRGLFTLKIKERNSNYKLKVNKQVHSMIGSVTQLFNYDFDRFFGQVWFGQRNGLLLVGTQCLNVLFKAAKATELTSGIMSRLFSPVLSECQCMATEFRKRHPCPAPRVQFLHVFFFFFLSLTRYKLSCNKSWNRAVHEEQCCKQKQIFSHTVPPLSAAFGQVRSVHSQLGSTRVYVHVEVRARVCFQSRGRAYRWRRRCEAEGGQSLPYLTGPEAEGLFDSVVALCYWSLIVWHFFFFFPHRMDREGWRDGESDF